MLNYLKKDYGFTLLLAVLLVLSVLSSCKREEPLSIEDRINAVEPAEENGTYSITIGSKSFLFTPETYFIDSGGGLFSGKQNAEIDENIVGRYCLAGWSRDDKTRRYFLRAYDIDYASGPVGSKGRKS